MLQIRCFHVYAGTSMMASLAEIQGKKKKRRAFFTHSITINVSLYSHCTDQRSYQQLMFCSSTQKQKKGEAAMEIARGNNLLIESQQYFSIVSAPSTSKANSCP